MKFKVYLYRLIPILIVGLLMSCGLAYAGVWGTVTGFVKAEAVSVAVGVLIGALGVFGATYKLWGVAVKELGECVWKMYQATRPDSDGGRSITGDEMQGILDEAADIYPAVKAAIASHKK